MNFLGLPLDLEQRIYAAFDGVQLHDGVGYFEADAIDGYLEKNSPEYNSAREKDTRNDWRTLVSAFSKAHDELPLLFMDAAGLHYYLPIFLLTGTALDLFQTQFLKAIENNQPSEYIKLCQLLTSKQKSCLLEVYERLADYSGWVEHFIVECDFSSAEAIDKTENRDEYIALLKLKKYLEN